VPQDDDPIGVLDGGEAMSDHQGGAVAHQLLQGGLDVTLGLRIQGRCRLIQNKDRRILEHGSGNREALALPTGEQDTSITDEGIEAAGQGVNETQGVGSLGHPFELAPIGPARITVGDVVGDRIVEQNDVLGH
jgi:hypothetical protein